MIARRLVLTVAAALMLRRAAGGQSTEAPVVGFLHSGSPAEWARLLAAFREGLGEAGYVEGRNVTIEYRWAHGHYDRLPALAADLVQRKVAVITAGGGTVAARVAKAATQSIPIVVILGLDPVASGMAHSLGRPGANITGVTLALLELSVKRIELLLQIAPQAATIGILVNPDNAIVAEPLLRDVSAAAQARGWQLHALRATTEREIADAFATLRQRRADALSVGADPFFTSRRSLIVMLAAQHAIPAIYESRDFAMAGGLISYGPKYADAYRTVGNYTGRILKGAKPADLPIQQPATFELVINVKTARTLGIHIPLALLARADEVIE